VFVFYTNSQKMKKILLLLCLVFAIACNSNSTNEEVTKQTEEKILTKEEKLLKLYKESVIPLFKAYKDTSIPTVLKIDKKDFSINAGAAFGYIEISQGLVNLSKEHIQLFTLAHEVAHIIILQQAAIFNLGESIPRGPKTNDYKKAEYLADLTALSLIKTKIPKEFEVLLADFPYLQNLLGATTFTHPSGNDRIDSLTIFLENSKLKGNNDAFKQAYIKIWQMQ